jgi:acylpyruvate hydrolase
MKLARVERAGSIGLAVAVEDGIKAIFGDSSLSDLDVLVGQGRGLFDAAARVVSSGEAIDEAQLRFLPPLGRPPKIICLGLNYFDHASEGGFEPPTFPTLFARFQSSLVGHGQAIIRPAISERLDYEGELVAVIGKAGKAVTEERALDHVAAYSIFNDGSIRDFQMKTPQWTAGKNFDGTGAFGPWLVTPDAVPPGASGLRLETRLNGKVVQQASTSDMIFDVATTISLLSRFLTLETGDVLVMGTPAGVGFARKPPLFMSAGDVVEVEIEHLGILRNPIVDG